jgi:hypothetical protein
MKTDTRDKSKQTRQAMPSADTAEEGTTMRAADIARGAKEQLAQLTGLKPDTVSGLTRDGEGWHVMVEMIELKRVPGTTDVLATYEVMLDDQGNLLRYQRGQRYYRSQVAAERAL